MNENDFKEKIGRLIFVLTITIFLLIGLIALIDGYAEGQAFDLFTKLAPFKAIYLTAFVTFVIANKYDKLSNKPPRRLKKLYTNTAFLIVSAHFGITVILIVLSGWSGGLLRFEVLVDVALPTIEGIFGGLTGLIIPDIFKNVRSEKELYSRD